MATYSIVEATPIYYLVDVSFAGMTFRQLIASSLVNGNLSAMLQAYADQYEQDWLAANADAVA
jgi:type II secretory pathway component PulF